MLGSKVGKKRWRPSESRIAGWVARAAVLVLVVVGCRQILDDFIVSKDAGKDASVPAVESIAPDTAPQVREAARCAGQSYPPAPTTADAGGDITFVTLLHTTNWADLPVDGGLPPYQRIGLNLDGLCTTSNPATAPCQEPPWAHADHADGPLGIDNASGQTASLYQGAITRSDFLRENEGIRAYLVRVTGYNGAQDDAAVRVTWYSATRATRATDTPVPDAGQSRDVWNVFDKFVPNSNAKYETPLAYVNHRTLVANFGELLLGGPDEFVTVEKCILVAQIVSENGEWILRNLTLAGRWPVSEMVASLSLLSGQTDCAGPTELTDTGKREIAIACDVVDISLEGDKPGAQCDAISFGVTFDGSPGQLGQDVVTTMPSGTCVNPPSCEDVIRSGH